MSISPSKAKALIKRISRIRILVIGDVMLDHYIWGDATRISPEAPVPVIDIARDSYTAGGAANVAINISSLGAQCAVLGFIGDDADGERLRAVLKDKGVEAIGTPGTGNTIVKTRVMVQHQQLCRLDRESPPSAYGVDIKAIVPRLREAIRSSDAVILSDYAKGLIGDALVSKVTEITRDEGKFIALDPKPKHPLHFRNLDLITPNKREALQLAGIEAVAGTPFPAEAVCARLHERFGTKYVVVTLGEDGMLLGAGGKVLKLIPTAAKEIYDVSGAGDTALAGLVLALTCGSGLEEAAHFANAAAGVVVAKLGTATVSPGELLAHLSHAK